MTFQDLEEFSQGLKYVHTALCFAITKPLKVPFESFEKATEMSNNFLADDFNRHLLSNLRKKQKSNHPKETFLPFKVKTF